MNNESDTTSTQGVDGGHHRYRPRYGLTANFVGVAGAFEALDLHVRAETFPSFQGPVTGSCLPVVVIDSPGSFQLAGFVEPLADRWVGMCASEQLELVKNALFIAEKNRAATFLTVVDPERLASSKLAVFQISPESMAALSNMDKFYVKCDLMEEHDISGPRSDDGFLDDDKMTTSQPVDTHMRDVDNTNDDNSMDVLSTGDPTVEDLALRLQETVSSSTFSRSDTSSSFLKACLRFRIPSFMCIPLA